MKRRLLALVLVVTMVFGSTQIAHATVSDAQKGLNSTNKKIKEIEQQQEALQAEIDALDSELVSLLVDIEIIEEEITAKQAELQQAQVDLQAAEEKKQKQYDDMKKRIVYMYENSSVSLIQALLEADSFVDMINRVYYFNEVYTYDRNLLSEYEATVVEVENLISQVKEDEAELEEIKVSYEEQEAALQAKISEKQSSMDNFDSQLADAKALARQYKNTIAAQQQVINSTVNNNSSSSSSSSSNNSSSSSSNSSSSSSSSGGTTYSGSGQAVVDYAYNFIGNPYVYGGTSLTNGIDCSAFVQAVYRNFGVTLPRTSYSQRSVGRAVSVSEIQPGDIVCYSGHVAIYAGNGQIVHASNSKPYPAGGIKVSRYNYRTIITVRRIFE
ncbi:MAG: C40 family peptidase [Eubacterium sp.]|nr:C40 family peptidase [Eubacterium sp.]